MVVSVYAHVRGVPCHQWLRLVPVCWPGSTGGWEHCVVPRASTSVAGDDVTPSRSVEIAAGAGGVASDTHRICSRVQGGG